MKGIQVEPEIEIQIDLNVSSYIPDEYIPDANQKIEIYQNIALCQNETDIQNIIDEIIDRFGNLPEELENLIDIARIKYLAKRLKISKIASKEASPRISKQTNQKTAVVFTFEPNKIQLDLEKLIEKYRTKIKFSNGIKPMITLEINDNHQRQILKEVTQFLWGIWDRH